MSQQPMEYARHAADAAVQPGAGDIRRRGRRHDRRVATLTAAGVLPAAGLGTGLDLRGGGTTPSRSAPNVVLRPGGLGVAAFGATSSRPSTGCGAGSAGPTRPAPGTGQRGLRGVARIG